jgi:GTPase Era involved in 16S rRNA processing
MNDLERNSGSDIDSEASFNDEKLDEIVRETQIKSTSPSTMKTYLSMMKELQKSIPERRIYYNPSENKEETEPITAAELLRFLGRKRIKKPNLTKGYLS